MDNGPIGFLDSGVGGLTVIRELMRQLPHEEIVYIGDSARAPYGPRPAEQIREYTWELVNFLLTKNVKMIVFACNTATAVAWKEVKKNLIFLFLVLFYQVLVPRLNRHVTVKLGLSELR